MKQWEYVIPPTVQEVAVRGHSEQSANAGMAEKLINAKTNSTVARKLFICYLLARTYSSRGRDRFRPAFNGLKVARNPDRNSGFRTDLVQNTSLASHCLIGVFDLFESGSPFDRLQPN